MSGPGSGPASQERGASLLTFNIENLYWGMPLHDGDLDLALLTLLSGQERYGLDLAKELRTLTGGDLDLNAGTLYPALHRLERRGWLSSHTKPSPRGGHALRYYTLTDEGERHYQAKRDAYQRWHEGLTTRWGNS